MKAPNPQDYFDVETVKKFVTVMINHDEPERALLILDNLPAFYRDFIPVELAKLKSDILKACITTHAYMTCNMDCNVNFGTVARDNLLCTLRGSLLRVEVQRYADKGIVPHLVDIGPGEYFVPFGLNELGFKFTYKDIACDQNTQKQAKPALEQLNIGSHRAEDAPTIFIANEIIEHLPSPKDLAIECLRHCGTWPERIHLSTPMYSYDVTDKDWNKPNGLPHLRAYTPKEFIDEARKVFLGYEWQFYPNDVMSLRGMRNDKKDDKFLEL